MNDLQFHQQTRYDLGTNYWGEHREFPLNDWKDEVAQGNTRLGYWQWVIEQLED